MQTNRPGSEGNANGIVSQLLPEGCSKKRFRRLLISVFRLLDLEIGPADCGKGESLEEGGNIPRQWDQFKLRPTLLGIGEGGRLLCANQIELRLARDEEFVAVVGEVGVVLTHYVDLLAAPFGNCGLRVQFDRKISAFAQLLDR
jgi:hypothetical protein